MPKWIPKLHDAQWLRKAYRKKNTHQIAKILGCVPAAVIQALHRHRIKTRLPGRKRGPACLRNKNWLIAQYVTKKLSTREIARKAGCSQVVAWKHIQRAGIELRQPAGEGPYPTNGKGKHLHRFKMERFLRRKLNSREHVHHIDENRKNPRLGNLILLSEKDHHSLHKWIEVGKRLHKLKAEGSPRAIANFRRIFT